MLQPRLVWVLRIQVEYCCFLTVRSGSLRFREPQLPSYTPGVHLADKAPPECWQAGMGRAPKTPFRDTSPTAPTKRFETRAIEPESSEDCLFLKYIIFIVM